jgi:2'-5' RNA ligase
MTIVEVVDDKQYDAKVERKTVVDAPGADERRAPTAVTFLLQVAQAAQSVVPWGYNPIQRDKELRSFWHTESWLASVVYSVSIRNASFAWEVIGSDPEKTPPKNTIRTVTRILKQSNRGKGWKDFILKTCIDLYTQDNGSFWEIIRNGSGPNAPVINLAHLDAARCRRTGDPKTPVIYYDRWGNEIFLPHWRVRTIEELPSPLEDAYGLQYCAVTRALLAAEIIASISVYKSEKVSGNFTRALDFISGVNQHNIDDGLALAEEQNLNRGQYRFSVPVIIPGIDPTSSLSHVHIDLASLPDNFDEDTSFKWYVAQLAAAFGVDYQEIAPLMTGNLGSSQQSEIMHLKTRGKGPALIMGVFEDVINELMPDNVKFNFLEQDIRSEREKAETQFTRAKDRSMRVKTGELTPRAAREMAVLSKDMPRWLKNEIDAEEERNQQEAVVQQSEDEFGPTQLDEGVETEIGTRRLTMNGVRQLQQIISEHPYDIMQKWYKASVGSPSGTVISHIWVPSRAIDVIKAPLMARWSNERVRFIPESDYHITLVHSPLVDDMEYAAVSKSMVDFDGDFEFTMTASKISHFDTPNGKAIVLLADSSAILSRVQRHLYDKFNSLGVPLSEFSEPEDWKPHITLAYVDSEISFEDIEIEPLRFWVEFPRFTRSSYRNEYFDESYGEVKADVMDH